ncbi:hypothetical protein PFICI_01302 [Pestalotiopsis fici W106-1]|uniref:Uncharacterized protein n=1 Tax=Pestalotiopsis fici (strain W106-1 / CGMCC3.15140) TaxID=1229662 RepID=W3XNA5_PESFW|nr:uncharacterized protein PFICI_01302 [Pestalotiopsis fici W106-1]ETS87474.1 hypothetical protein PFICI_01302 [Pestalotiopsis fici W106-1]
MKDFVALRSFVQPYFARFEDAEGNAFLGGPDNEEQYHYSAAFRQVLAEHFWRLCRAFYALRQSHTRQFHLAGSKKEAKKNQGQYVRVVQKSIDSLHRRWD